MKLDRGQNVRLVVSLLRFIISVRRYFYSSRRFLGSTRRNASSFRRFTKSTRRFLSSTRRLVCSTRRFRIADRFGVSSFRYVQGWTLALAHSPRRVEKLSGEYKSQITRPVWRVRFSYPEYY